MREKEKVRERENKGETAKGKRELKQQHLLWSSKNSLENRKT